MCPVTDEMDTGLFHWTTFSEKSVCVWAVEVSAAQICPEQSARGFLASAVQPSNSSEELLER